MPNDTDSENELTKQQQKLREIAVSFAKVFGAPDSRTKEQKIVMETLESSCYMHRPLFVQDATGAVCPVRAALTEGKRTAILEINAWVKRGTAPQDETEQPKKRKRTTK